MEIMIRAKECYYCGEGPAGQFEVDEDGFPICESCIEDQWNDDYYAWDYMQEDPYGDWE